MKIVCMGDSLTEGDYGYKIHGVANIHDENYPYFLSKITGAEVLNYGKCGFTSLDYINFFNTNNLNLKETNIIIIMLGTNGGLSVDEETEANKAYIEIIQKCKLEAPDAEIVLCAPPHATEDNSKVNFGYAERVKNAQGFVLKTAKELNLKLIDFRKDNVFSAQTEDEYQSIDGLHFNREGYLRMADYIAKELGLV